MSESEWDAPRSALLLTQTEWDALRRVAQVHLNISRFVSDPHPIELDLCQRIIEATDGDLSEETRSER